MSAERVLKKNFWVGVLALVGLAALLHAQAVAQLIGVALLPDEQQLSARPAANLAAAPGSAKRAVNAGPILARNPFDHVTGPLNAPPEPEEGASGPTALDTTDPFNAPACDGVNVIVVAASSDPDWSFAALAGSDGKAKLRRRGDELGGKKVFFVGSDRVWFDGAGTLCQASLFDKKNAPAPAASAAPAPSASGPTPRGGKPLDPVIKNGIQKVGATEFNIERKVVEKIFEDQAQLMRSARIVPEQENGRTVGVRLMAVKPDSLLGVLGMSNGDRLQTINGFDVANPEKALEAYARLRTADKLTVTLNRGGKNMNLDYNIK